MPITGTKDNYDWTRGDLTGTPTPTTPTSEETDIPTIEDVLGENNILDWTMNVGSFTHPDDPTVEDWGIYWTDADGVVQKYVSKPELKAQLDKLAATDIPTLNEWLRANGYGTYNESTKEFQTNIDLNTLS